MVSLIQLEYVVAIDTYRNFSTAADHCFVTQPTLSMQVKKLEEHLGVILFDRSKQPVIPTDVGAKIVQQAREILRQAGKINEIIIDHQGEIRGELKMGIIPTLAPYLLPLFVGDFTRKYPGISLHVKELVTEEIVHRLKKDLIDVGILVTPLKDPEISETPLFYEEIKVYASHNHKFSLLDAIPLPEVASPELWMLGEGHCFRHQVVNLCSYQAIQPQLPFAYESGSLETLKVMVDKEGGFTLLPELSTNAMPDDRQNQVKSFHPARPLREVSLVTVRNYAKDRLLAVLSAAIREAIPVAMLDAKRGTTVEWK